MKGDMAVVYSSRLTDGACNTCPDDYRPQKSDYARPSNSLTISRDKQGSILSRYGDPIYWDLSPYQTSPSQETRLYWDKIPPSTVADAKWIVFVLTYLVSSGSTVVLTVGTLGNYYKVIKKVCKYAAESNVTVIDVLESEQHIAKVSRRLINYSSHMSYLTALLSHLLALDPIKTGLRPLGGRTIGEIRMLSANGQNSKQNPVIPPRILNQLLTQLWALINSHRTIQEPLASFVTQCIQDKQYGRSYTKKENCSGKNGNATNVVFKEAAIEHDVHSYLQCLGITSLQSLQRYYIALQDAGRHLLHVYSGMRRDEMLSLQLDCLTIEQSRHGHVVRLIGKTSKLVGQPKTVAWITSKESEVVVDVLQSIAKLVVSNTQFANTNHSLFPSPSYLGFVGKRPSAAVCSSYAFAGSSLWGYIDKLSIAITEDDLEFLNLIDDTRAWQDEETFQLGKPWQFTTHQYRRTLAYYCRQSGLVKLTTLKRQLKHITREMTLYYAKGGEFDGLFSDKDHFVNEFKRSKDEVDALGYIYDLILSEETLFGGHGRQIERSGKPCTNSQRTILNYNRDEIIKRFKRGELAYKETALGACTTTESCDRKLQGIVSACVSCPDAVLKPSKINKAVIEQQRFVGLLDVGSIEYRTESSELEVLVAQQTKMQKQE